jgi:hypothetical protein
MRVRMYKFYKWHHLSCCDKKRARGDVFRHSPVHPRICLISRMENVRERRATGKCIRDGICLCSKIWVLVVSNDFDGIQGFDRRGNNADIQNLRRVFHEQRHCRFAELRNCGREEIINTFSSADEIKKLFNRNGEREYFLFPLFNLLFI